MYHSEYFPVSDPLDVLPDHTLEHILACIPLPSVCATRCVSKRWRSLTAAPTFLALYSQLQEQPKSWLYVNGFRYKITDLSSLPNTSSSTSPAPKIPGHLWGAGGITYALPDPSPHQTLHYKLSTLDTQWQQTPALTHSRTFPIIGAIKNLKNGAHKVICAGGLSCDGAKESLAKVELFDSESQAWEECQDLPAEFQDLATSRSVTAVVCNNRKLYLFHIYSGIVTSFDVITKRWSAVKTLRPPEVQYCYLAVRNGGLLLVGVNNESNQFLFRGWNVDQASMECSGPSWPVLCHFASTQTPVDASKKKQVTLSQPMEVYPSAALQPVVCKYFVAVAGCVSRRITNIIGIFDAVLEFSKAIS